MSRPSLRRPAIITLALLMMQGLANAEPVESIKKRFAAAKVKEVPDFQKHVVPLMGKLGCNGRACHGSFQGQGGFRLSLFGFDFKMDIDNLTKGEDPRVDLDDPEFSLMLEKATLNHPHKGGKRMKKGSWEYNVFLAWIKGGAKAPVVKRLAKLDVTPKEIVFAKKGQKQQLKAVAIWEDGSKEDVTTLCRFKVNDDQIATVDGEGLLTSNKPGDSHAVIFYDNAVVPIPVMQPVSNFIGKNYPVVETRTKVDALVVEKLKKIGVVPSGLCTDGEFIRRVSLDLTGTLPSAVDVKAFLADKSANKRKRLVEKLMKSPAYAAWWTTRFSDWTGNNDYQLRNTVAIRGTASQQWYQWLYKRINENMPYDKIVAGLVLAKGREGKETYQEYCKAMTDITVGKAKFEDRETLPHFWARRNMRRAEEKALGFAYTFMGIRIQCAQCHKHPFDQWTQNDYKQFTNFFGGVSFGLDRQTRTEYNVMIEKLGLKGKRGGELRRMIPKLVKEGKVVPFQEVYVTPIDPNLAKRIAAAKKRKRRVRFRGRVPTAKLLGDDKVNLMAEADPRAPLMEWLRDKENPYFAKAFVNRLWENYFGRGIVSPTDDLSLANPPVNKPLFDYLAKGFIESGFDMKWLHREIILSDTYQRSWRPTETNSKDEKNFARAIPRRLPAEVAYDAIVAATLSDEKAKTLLTETGQRAIARTGSNARNYRGNGSGYALQIFGRSIRESQCDCDRSNEPSLLQTVFLRNDDELYRLIDSRDGWVTQVDDQLNPGKKRARNVKRPKNYYQTIRTYRQQIARYQQRNQREAADRVKKKLNKYLARYPLPQRPQKPDPSQFAKIDVKKLISDAYLRTLSRYPSEDEIAKATRYLKSSAGPTEGLRGLMWALINTKEFIVNH